ncbi:transcriptional regulator with XRE-family HTH domain [Pseudoduganella flava]|uniref:Helix-turn-helix domain-containing protein n=1 Tax=Pseudoduganella flava TaxID=871742 RepID=A0A562PT71_9BURK|nr:XRE family transcriptional regulator [Pseudoduganella flava]QGZ39074.1 helix-turn-helix domain-containing protein [Pseudoduganella flava]TWI47647.1 transcriptional regulator with XRE-family HTH domain [Pseudoduganella flava]
MGNHDEFETKLVARLAALREQRGWSLDELAKRSGISRATLSRLERGETSPTAALLGKLCAAYGLPMSRLIAAVEEQGAQLIKAAEQAVWTDPASGFTRRMVSPPAQGMRAELIEGRLPAGAVIDYEAPPVSGLEQHIWMLDGLLEYTLDGTVHTLQTGDCLRFRLYGATRFACPGPMGAHYLIAICEP